MDESQDKLPHVHIHEGTHVAHEVAPNAAGVHLAEKGRNEISIWFFCGILMLVYGIVLVAQGIYEHFGHQPNTVLASLEPTLWWGVALSLFGGFYTWRFLPGKR